MGLAALLLVAVASGCARHAPSGGTGTARPAAEDAGASSSVPVVSVAAPVSASGGPLARSVQPNPLGFPPRRAKLDVGRRVFTFPQAMLEGAKLGSTLVLYGATVSGLDGGDLVIEGRGGPPYKVHPGYVIAVPDDPKVRPGDAVLVEHAGVMKHAVITKQVKARTFVRFTDLDARAPEVGLTAERLVKQVEGLAPGNYAALSDEGELRHVLLVSAIEDGAHKRWFVLAFAGAAKLVDEVALRPIPLRFRGRVGEAVLAESVGTMRRATLQSVVEPAFFTVKFERAGRPVTLGWGFLLGAPKP